MWEIFLSKKAVADLEKIKNAGLEEKVISLLKILQENPFTNPPPYEKLVGDLSGYYSRRINIKHRLVYKVMKEEQIVQVFRMWTHYE
ncbi:Txe/YoeB family addiction module toxin [Scytonema sp. NUACC21]